MQQSRAHAPVGGGIQADWLSVAMGVSHFMERTDGVNQVHVYGAPYFTRTVVGAYVMSPTLPVSHILRTVFSLMPPVRPIPWMLGWYGWASDFSDTSDSSRAPVHNEPASTKNSSRKHEKCVRLMLGLSVEAQCLLDSFPNETGTLSPLLQMPLYCPRSFSGTATYR